MRSPGSNLTVTRRAALAAGVALGPAILLRPARAQSQSNGVEAAIREFAGEAKLEPGKVHLDLPPLVENGNAVPLKVTVDSPMTATDYVKRIAVFNEKNPQPHIIAVELGPRAGRASVATRVRLANSQKVTAIAELSDGSFWSDSADVIVTLAACVEDL
jgi:sulfur-oxidizing protein SoxY